MTLIKCPECGQEISDKATTCPHCGVQIFVCPECGQVSVGNPRICPKCGYMNAAQPAVVQTREGETDTENEKSTDIVEQWLKANPGEKKWFSVGLSILLNILFLCFIGIFLCMLFFIERPFETLQEKGYEALEMVLNYKIYIRNVWILAIFICVLWFVYCCMIFYVTTWSNRCGRWLRVKKINVRESLKNESQEFQSGVFSGYKEIYGYKIQNLGRAYTYDMVLRKKNNNGLVLLSLIRLTIGSIFLISLVLLYASALCDLIENNAVLGLQMQLFTEESVLNFLPGFGAVMGIMILLLIVILIVNSKQKKSIEKTIRQALSE